VTREEKRKWKIENGKGGGVETLNTETTAQGKQRAQSLEFTETAEGIGWTRHKATKRRLRR
jgi:hypothetical protein